MSKVKPLSTRTACQRERLAKYFKAYRKANTLEIREKLGILSPAPRVLELRALGYNIRTEFVDVEKPYGVHKDVGLYVLINTPEEA